MRKERGFSVLELVVALAILAAVLVPMLTLQNQLLSNFLRYDDAFDRMTMTRNALALLADVDPMTETGGRLRLDERTELVWRAEAISEEHPQALSDGTSGDFRIRLYRIDADILRTDGRRMTSFSYETLGHRQVVSFEDPAGEIFVPR
ncbi:MAG: prepilin-type N-terminal cleavage/methylation domain-containing protein [Parvularcula sp.]|jgi:prepilin-type N-terminal cleavage/methylation domain-containing protein|nr:prepilin-type N-terminal cleavage/methylation domain-containing protein [Parvularcula sp.]